MPPGLDIESQQGGAQLEQTDGQPHPVVPQCRVDTMTLVDTMNKDCFNPRKTQDMSERDNIGGQTAHNRVARSSVRPADDVLAGDNEKGPVFRLTFSNT
ncbi:hypothetical protein LEMLEM_LOCUS23739 [Lemmus lemmus]